MNRSLLFLTLFLTNACMTLAQDSVLAVLDAVSDTLTNVQVEEYQPVDSVYLREIEELLAKKEKETKARKVIEQTEQTLLNEEMSFSYDGTFRLLRGGLMMYTEDEFNDRPGLFKEYGYSKEDYGVALVPLAANWILKAAGVESRSKTNRMLLANSMSIAISAGLTKTLKMGVDENRPDGDGYDSFPSGHSSLAFVSATILHREYGHHSPWISVGGYATATATQLLRVKHNRHWVHDTFVGAGIGIMSTNLAYFITDRIFGTEGINQPRLTHQDMTRVLKFNDTPLSFAFITGSENGSRTIDANNVKSLGDYAKTPKIHVGVGFMAGVEGSWFLNRYFAVEGMAKYVTAKAKTDFGGVLDAPSVYGANLDFYRFNVGTKLSLPYKMTNRFSCRLFAGTRIMSEATFESVDSETSMFSIPSEAKFDIGGSISYDCVNTKKYSYGFTFDYHHTFSDIMPNRYGISTVWRILL